MHRPARRGENAGSRTRRKRLLTLMTGGLVSLAAAGALAKGPSPSRADLEQAVVEALLQRSGTPAAEAPRFRERTEVNLKRLEAGGGWAFGAGVILAPPVEGAMPEGWLFVARATPEGWQVGLEGSPAFVSLVQDAPVSMVGQHEKDAFAAASALDAAPPDLRLPWDVGKSWYLTGGLHGWSGSNLPYSSIDLDGGDRIVRAAGAGNVYTMCSTEKGWIRIVHSNGFASDYYHLWNNIKPVDGSTIAEGARLGDTGTDVSCGGAASGRHVHFALRKSDGGYLPLDGKTIGGWTFKAGSRAYNGSASHGTTVRYPGSALYNYGH